MVVVNLHAHHGGRSLARALALEDGVGGRDLGGALVSDVKGHGEDKALEWKLMSCSQLADLAYHCLLTLLQPIRSQLAC